MPDRKNNTVPPEVWVTHQDIQGRVYLHGVNDKPWEDWYDAPITKTASNTRYVPAGGLPAKVWLLQAEHFFVPGMIVKVFTFSAVAQEEAADLVRIMQKDAGLPADATAANWSAKFEAMKATLSNQEAGDCYVEINEVPLIGGRT